MPCESEGYGPSEKEIWVQLAFPAACEMMRVLTKQQLESLSPKTKLWISEHERYDRERKEEEAERKRREKVHDDALAKLSKAEREALGIYK
jgi:hypothetical protein